MSTFLGPVGSLIPVKCASRLTSSGGRQVSFGDTLGKRKAFLGRVSAREWSVDIGLAKPQELSGLRWLAENVNSPMVWYSPDAVVGNIMPPDQADIAPGTHRGLEGPLVEVEPGVWVKSVFPDAYSHPDIQRRPGGGVDPAPVPAGATIAAAVWMRGNTLAGRQLHRVAWYAADNTFLSADEVDFPVSDDWVRREVTVVAPAGAVGARLTPSAEQVAGPTITLTDRVMPYSPGRGATSVVAHGLSDAVLRATVDQQLQSLSFTVSEVG